MADRPDGNPRGGRSPVLAPNAMIATSQPLATAAGLAVLAEGGHAVDAAIAAAAVLCVVEPMMTGLGGDLFAIVWDEGKGELRGLNASGGAPAALHPGVLAERGLSAMPARGPLSITVPGAVDGWRALHEAYGRLPFDRLLRPAIAYAEGGYPVSELIAAQWRRNQAVLAGPARDLFLPAGRPPRHGERIALPPLAATLRVLAERGPRAFYEGDVADAIAAGVRAQGGLLAASDLAGYRCEWVTPISTRYRGYEVFELPPNGQGMLALQMLNIMEPDDVARLGHGTAEYLHLLIEAKRLAFADRDRYLGDPAWAEIPVSRLLDKEYARRRRALIDPDRAAPYEGPGAFGPGLEIDGDTVYLTAVDRDRNAVSFIQSLFTAFGSGVLAGDTGVLMHCRGALFALEPGHPNELRPGKRPLHTILPAMVVRGGRPVFSFGVMGGDMQPQGHVQVLQNIIDFGMDVQQAGEAPRIRHTAREVCAESGIGPAARHGLIDRGHKVVSAVDVFGGYQGIWIDAETGTLRGGSDPRKDGCALGF